MNIKMIIDLSHDIYEGMPIFPGDVETKIEQWTTIKEKGYNLTKIQIGSHCGTHVDFPYHFIEYGARSDEVSLSKLVGEAVVADLSYLEPGSEITAVELEREVEELKQDDILLINSGMSKFWGEEEYLTNYTYITPSAADWMINKKVKAFGFDWLSIEKYGNNDVSVHHMLLSRGIPIIESLNNLERVKSKRILFICAPFKFRGIEGAPCRAFCIEFRE